MYYLLAQIEFESTARLCWLAVLPVVAYFAWRSRVSGAIWRRVAIWACRTVGLTLLVLAYAGIRSRTTSDQRHVVFVADVSRSVTQEGVGPAQQFIDAALPHQGQHRVSFLAFAGRPGPVSAQPPGSPDVDKLASDPAAALRVALASLDPDCVPQVVLLTDGNETQGSLARAAAGVDVPVYVKPLPAFPTPETCVLDVIAPPLASLTGDVPIEVRVASNHAGPAKLELLGSAAPTGAQSIQLKVGENRFHLRGSAGERPSAVFEVRLSAAKEANVSQDKSSPDRGFGCCWWIATGSRPSRSRRCWPPKVLRSVCRRRTSCPKRSTACRRTTSCCSRTCPRRR
jgi:Ca-activated chloride channel family protein